jgi:serine/threonine protein kinase
VNYLIFERADGDCRDILDACDEADALLAVRLTHDCAVALAQLHQQQITHQDVKPANLLGWRSHTTQWSAKLADLGRAFCASMEGPHAGMVCPGDTVWASPEVLYALDGDVTRSLRQRQLSDIFSLGSLLCYVLTGVPYGGLIALELDENHRWTRLQGGYEEAKPFLAEAHAKALGRLREAVHSEAADLVIPLIEEMCHPIVELRGVRRMGHALPSTAAMLERYVSRLDLIAKKIAITRSVAAKS